MLRAKLQATEVRVSVTQIDNAIAFSAFATRAPLLFERYECLRAFGTPVERCALLRLFIGGAASAAIFMCPCLVLLNLLLLLRCAALR